MPFKSIVNGRRRRTKTDHKSSPCLYVTGELKVFHSLKISTAYSLCPMGQTIGSVYISWRFLATYINLERCGICNNFNHISHLRCASGVKMRLAPFYGKRIMTTVPAWCVSAHASFDFKIDSQKTQCLLIALNKMQLLKTITLYVEVIF